MSASLVGQVSLAASMVSAYREEEGRDRNILKLIKATLHRKKCNADTLMPCMLSKSRNRLLNVLNFCAVINIKPAHSTVKGTSINTKKTGSQRFIALGTADSLHNLGNLVG